MRPGLVLQPYNAERAGTQAAAQISPWGVGATSRLSVCQPSVNALRCVPELFVHAEC
eukprot:COSAG03_NODE_6397_length_1066_cov_1.050672_2_plen_56_part_01